MTIESVTWVNDLDPTYPAEGETGTLHEGNNHIRNLKTALKNSFPNIGSAMSASAGVLNKLIGLTATAGDLNVLQGAAAAGVTMTSIAGLAGLTATAGELNIIGDVTVTAAQLNAPTAMTKIDTTSGSAANFTSVPSWTKKITLLMADVSTTAAASIRVQIGDSGGLETSGYQSGRMIGLDASSNDVSTDDIGFTLTSGGGIAAGGDTYSGVIAISKLDGNTWAAHGGFWCDAASATNDRFVAIAGYKTLSGVLDRISVVSGGTFDGGMVNVLYE